MNYLRKEMSSVGQLASRLRSTWWAWLLAFLLGIWLIAFLLSPPVTALRALPDGTAVVVDLAEPLASLQMSERRLPAPWRDVWAQSMAGAAAADPD